MTTLHSLCKSAGLARITTYIASGNVVFESAKSERAVKAALESKLAAYAGKPVAVIVRTAREWSDVLRANPFPRAPANRTVAIFLNDPPAAHVLERAVGRDAEEFALGVREIYVSYGIGMAHSKLKFPGAAGGTARNMNTVARVAGIAEGYAVPARPATARRTR
jgi:uncharacterized protein (DUF1697 family)